jgi:hypothetical protein
MMNFSYFSFSTAVQLVERDMAMARYVALKPEAQPPNEAHRSAIQNHLEFLSRKCAELLLERAEAWFQRIWLILATHYSYLELSQELETLLQAVEDDIKLEYFFHYRRDRGILLLLWRGEWVPTLNAFPSAVPEIEEGIDCLGLSIMPRAYFI